MLACSLRFGADFLPADVLRSSPPLICMLRMNAFKSPLLAWQLLLESARSAHFSTATTGDAASAKAIPSSSEQARPKEHTTVPLAEPRTLFVKREGDADWAAVSMDSAATVACLKEEIVRKLAITERLSTITLHVAKDNAGMDLGAALDSRATVTAAELENGASIVVKIAGALSAAPTAASLDASGTSHACI